MTENNKESTEKAFNPNLETVCPSCGRFAGTYERCPYCGREVYKRLSIKLVKLIALFMAFIGLFFLFLAAWNKDLPLVKVAEVTPTMNFAYVRIEGQAVSDARIFDYGGLSFTMNDSDDGKALESNVSIRAYSNIAAEMQKKDLLPMKGDFVKVAGSLKVREGSVSLIIQSPDQVTVVKREVKEKKIAEIDLSMLNEVVRIKAVITDLPEPRGNAPREVTVKDQSGQAFLKLWGSEYDKVRRIPGFNKNAMIEADVAVDEFRGRLQLWIKNERHVKVMSGASLPAYNKEPEHKPAAELTALDKISKDLVNREIIVEGTITGFEEPPGNAPNRISFKGSTGSNQLVVWKNVYSEIRALNGVNEGAQFRAKVHASLYKEQIQLKLKYLDDFELMTGADKQTDGPRIFKALPEITLGEAGTYYKTTGTVEKIETFGTRKNFKVVFAEKESSLELIFFANKFDKLPESVRVGARLTVYGQVNNYRNNLQMIIEEAEDVGGAE